MTFEERRPASLSATLIVKNEERFLEDCLLSIRDHVDEIIVVDTGSTDATCEIARRFGATLIERAWPGNFSEARNWALDAANGEWILYIDADERLIAREDLQLGDLLTVPDVAGYMLRFRPRVNATPYEELRIFRNDPRIRFKALIHEEVHSSLVEVCKSDGMRVASCAIELVHHGYEGDLTHKYRRNLPLLREAVKAYPNRIFNWHDLGNSLAGLGEIDEALEMYRQAISVGFAASGRKQNADMRAAWSAAALVMLADERDALDFIEEGLSHFPADYSLRLSHSRALIRAGRAEEALPTLDVLLAIDADTVFDPMTAYDRGIFGELSFEAKAIALMKLERFAEAAEAFEKASGYAPKDMSYRVKAAAARAQAARRGTSSASA